MARDHGRMFVSIWSDDDFRARGPLAQWLYMLLVSQPDLTHAGTLRLSVRRWAACSTGATVDDVHAALKDLDNHRFVIVDEDTDEVLVRSYLRRNEVWKQPNLFKLALRQVALIQSRRLRAALRSELLRLPTEPPDPKAQPGVATMLAEARAFALTLPEESHPEPPGASPGRQPGTHPERDAGTLPETHPARVVGTHQGSHSGSPTRARGPARNPEQVTVLPVVPRGKPGLERDTHVPRLPGRGRAEELNATARRPATQQLVNAWTDSLDRPPPSALLKRLRAVVDGMLDDGVDQDLIARALPEWSARGLGTALLPEIVHELGAGRRPRPAHLRPVAELTDEDLTREVIDRILGPDTATLPLPPLEVDEGPPDARAAWCRERAAERLAERRQLARAALAGRQAAAAT